MAVEMAQNTTDAVNVIGYCKEKTNTQNSDEDMLESERLVYNDGPLQRGHRANITSQPSAVTYLPQDVVAVVVVGLVHFHHAVGVLVRRHGIRRPVVANVCNVRQGKEGKGEGKRRGKEEGKDGKSDTKPTLGGYHHTHTHTNLAGTRRV